MFPMIRRNAWPASFEEPFTQLRREVDTLFDRFFGGDGGALTQAWSALPFTIWEDEDHFYVEADLPGVAEPDVNVTVHNGLLYVQGERKAEEGRNYLFNTRSFGRFERVVSLPASVATDDVKARLTNGVLRVELTKSLESKPKKITVQAS
jgi:HSP20 family protein